MAFYEWTDRLSIGDEIIDRQHHTLINYINSIAEVIEKENGSSISLSSLLIKLVTYTKTHFMYEEMLFEANHYPETDIHKKDHQIFTQQIDDIYTRFKSGDEKLGTDLLALLIYELNDHILGSDLAFIEFIKTQKSLPH